MVKNEELNVCERHVHQWNLCLQVIFGIVPGTHTRFLSNVPSAVSAWLRGYIYCTETINIDESWEYVPGPCMYSVWWVKLMIKSKEKGTPVVIILLCPMQNDTVVNTIGWCTSCKAMSKMRAYQATQRLRRSYNTKQRLANGLNTKWLSYREVDRSGGRR